MEKVKCPNLKCGRQIFDIEVMQLFLTFLEVIWYDIFSSFLAGLSEMAELPVDFNGKLFHRLVDYATVYSDIRTAG